MKKIIALCCLLLFSLPVFAAEWVEVGYKTYIDESTKMRNGYDVSAWVKNLNPGNWELENGKKIWFRIAKMHAQCGNRKIGVSEVITYDLKKNVVSSFDEEITIYYNNVVPDSAGETIYYGLCRKSLLDGYRN